jgi:predicted phosphodiesterase
MIMESVPNEAAPSDPRHCSRREILFKHLPAAATVGLLATGPQASLGESKPSTKFGVLSDIHGNAWALEAVLNDAHRRGVNAFVNLGDILYGPLAPRHTFDLLKKTNLVAQVLGNQDRLIINGTLNPTLEWVRRDLGDEPVRWLTGIPSNAQHNGWLLCHGTPDSDTTYLLEDVSSGRPEVRKESEIEALMKGCQASRILCGHTHLQRLVRLASGTIIVNPGSVGLPAYDDSLPVHHVMESFSPHARYAVVEGSTISFHQIEYDWNAAAAKARAMKRDDWARGLSEGRMS